MKLVGITGGIGSGKSLVARIFNCLGIPVYYADDRARWLSDHDPEIRQRVTDLLGSPAYTSEGMDRAWVAGQVFGNRDKLDALNAIIHPAVANDFTVWADKQKGPFVIKEAALLFESGSYLQLDAIINVSAPVDVRMQRTLARDPQRNSEEVKQIMSKQLTDEERREKSEFDILNDNNTLVIPQVLKIYKALLQEAV